MNRPWLNRYDEGVPQSLTYPSLRVFDFLDGAAKRFPRQTCTLYEGHAISYDRMAELTDQLARGLIALGLQKGERVSILLPNLPQYVLAYYAVLKAGGIVSAMNPAYTAREIEYQIQDSGSVFLIAGESSRALVEQLPSDLPLRKKIFTALEDAFTMQDWYPQPESGLDSHKRTTFTLEEITRWSFAGMDRKSEVASDDVAIFQYSGGTTGIPKAAVGLHRNLVANTLQFRAWLSGMEDARETALLAIPLYHVYGMVVGMSVATSMAARMVLIPNPRDLPKLLDAIQTYQVSFFPGVPTLYALINQHPLVQSGEVNLRSIRACISGSAPLLEEVRVRFESLTGAKLMEGYGLSEAPTATHCNPMLGEKRPGSIGLPLPDVDCRIVSLEDGETDLPVGEAGELLIRGPQVMQGYHNRPEETRQTLRNGWLYTGDIARMDEDGYFYVLDRKKDLIKVSGYQVWPREVEEVIATHPSVQEVGVAGIPHPVRGEAVKAWVVVKPGHALSADDIIQWCKQSLVYYKIPIEVEFLERLPRSTVGKLLRRVLVEQHRQAA